MAKYFFFLHFVLLPLVGAAQVVDTAAYVASIDSILKGYDRLWRECESRSIKNRNDGYQRDYTFYNDQLISVVLRSVVCEQIYLRLHNNALVCVDYTLTDPDIRSSPPPSRTHIIYFKEGLPIYSKRFDHWQESVICDAYDVSKMDFVQLLQDCRARLPLGP